MAEPKKAPTPTDEEVNKSREQDQNLDRDGRERQPTEQTDKK